MKSLPQTLALARYHAASNPWIFIFPLSFGLQGAIPTTRTYYSSLETAIFGTTLMMWIPLFFAAFLFAPQIFSGMSAMNAAQNQVQFYSEEFLFTRAVDRSNVFWSRCGIYAALLLMLLAMWMIPAVLAPSISLEVEASRAGYYLDQLPGSHIVETTKHGRDILLLPFATVWIKLWSAGLLLYSALLAPAFILLISTWRWKRWIFWIVFLGNIALMLALTIGRSGRSLSEPAFLYSLNHPTLFLIPLLALGFFALRYCRQRYVAQQVEG